jgi:hypothetical protein
MTRTDWADYQAFKKENPTVTENVFKLREILSAIRTSRVAGVEHKLSFQEMDEVVLLLSGMLPVLPWIPDA